MRFVKTGVLAIALTGASIIGAGAAHADQSITVSANMLHCATTAGINASTLTHAKVGDKITVSDATYSQLKAHSCL
ncbi:hypothetical protein KO481_07325 [Nocardia sp. NEAU-G5]|uniref:Uncharacterized protein n=1 Tax=Nocardia albiluteola TaxID=2842303 RepID=A0ABS6AVS2_9NOCA|nr:hypothetical protein [Nocardia albiluteola]MBU3061331.1 hypothetical protein [Nocardia albiluteola]